MRRGRVDNGYKGSYIGGISCSCGKMGYDKKGAQTKRNFMLKAGNTQYLRIYQCPQSNTWHITSKTHFDDLQ